MKKHIYLDRAGKGKLRQIFDCTDVMVWKALTFESDSELARKIRYTAIGKSSVSCPLKPSDSAPLC